jgi:hypothetical protein
MPDVSAKPIIFISYSHKDEPEKPGPDEMQWLTYVQSFLVPVVRQGVFELWVDEHTPGGGAWEKDIQAKLAQCDVFVLLVSRHSLASDYVIKTEMGSMRQRLSNGEDVHIYPIKLSSVPETALHSLRDLKMRPKDGKPLRAYVGDDRDAAMCAIADEIALLVAPIAERKVQSAKQDRVAEIKLLSNLPASVHCQIDISRLPGTAYKIFVGRDAELARLDAAWVDEKINLVSLIAWGGAGKTALVNEWLVRLHKENYRSAEAVLGWSFYSQGSNERATSAEPFLNWALEKLSVRVAATSPAAKGEAIADAITKRRILLILDGVEPLQYGVGPLQGQLKDLGLRAFLRRFASASNPKGLVVLTSRLSLKDISRWRDTTAPVFDLNRLSEEASVALLRNNGVWGTDEELQAAAKEFEGNPLPLVLVAAFLKERHFGDARRRDQVRELFKHLHDPLHDQAKRVMEAYEKEWLADQPALLSIMYLIGLFDRPASSTCLAALRMPPIIEGLTEAIIDIGDEGWKRAVARLREARLIVPKNELPSHFTVDPGALDAHPLVREWFGEKLRKVNANAWKEAHGRIYEHLRDSTKEGGLPSLEDLGPLYQAITHACRAGRYEEALRSIYIDRICRRTSDGRIEFYAFYRLGAISSDLAAISWFFEVPYAIVVPSIAKADQSWLLNIAAMGLRAQGRFTETLGPQRAALHINEQMQDWSGAAVAASNLSQVEAILGAIGAALETTELSIQLADRSGNTFWIIGSRTSHADLLFAAGRQREAELLFTEAERRQREYRPEYPLLYSLQGFQYCELLVAKGDVAAARDRAISTVSIAQQNGWLLNIALDTLTLGRASLALALGSTENQYDEHRRQNARIAYERLDEAIAGLRSASLSEFSIRGLLARAIFRRNVGDWEGTSRDLAEVEEIAEPGSMQLFLCDAALECARLAFARSEAFAPLNGLTDDSPPKSTPPGDGELSALHDEATRHLAIAAAYIEKCGYRRRDEELVELQAVLRGDRTFASLSPRV